MESSSTTSTTNQLFDHFWTLNRNPMGNVHQDGEGLCQCGTEKLIEKSANQNEMRTFLLVSVFIDQMIYTHFRAAYDRFSSNFRAPKLYSHGGYGMMSAGWLVYPVHGYDRKMDWDMAQPIANALFVDALTELENIFGGSFDQERFLEIAEIEIRSEFTPTNAVRFVQLVRDATSPPSSPNGEPSTSSSAS